MILIYVALFVLSLLLINEVWWRRNKQHSEFSRKFVHIVVGSFVAFWPYLMGYNYIRFLSIAFIVTVFFSKKYNIFKSIHSVNRPTLGEVCFALAVGLSTYTASSHLIYLIAMLHMSLADGMAAIVGTKFGKNNSYHALGNKKSVAGSATFLVISLILMTVYCVFAHQDFNIWIVALSGLITVVENISPAGLDNLLIPLVVALML